MARSLNAATRELEQTVATRTRELLDSRNEALQANAERRALLQRLHTIIEEERQSIALEVHDELNAVVIGARLDAERILQLLAQNPSTDTTLEQQIRQRCEAILQQLRALYANARKLVRRLRPEMLEMLGLAGALEDMLRHYGGSGCDFHFEASGALDDLPSGMAISVYRIVQEAVSNIIKHAQATQAQITLTRTADSLQVEIRDNGCGFAPEQAQGFGLPGLRERVAAWHGEAQLHTAPGQGCSWHIRLPLHA